MRTMRAVVIGGSVAGLAAASAVAPHVDEVVLVERHEPSPERPSTSGQGHLPHVLLAAGMQVLERLHPGFSAELASHGAYVGLSRTTVPCHWVAGGTVRRHLVLPDLGFDRAMCSRGLVESTLRRRTTALPNVRVVHASGSGLVVEQGRVIGMRLSDGETVEADLVVDATGRHTQLEDWLARQGLPVPPRTEVVVDLRYTGFLVPQQGGDFEAAAFAVVQNTPAIPRVGVALHHEDGLWQVALGGYFGQGAPIDPAGAQAFAASMASPVLADLMTRPFVQAPARYTFRSSLRRHWERQPVEGLAVVGDAVASFNPLYGQGMTAALLQADALGAAIAEQGFQPGLSRTAARAAAKVVANPWTIATGADFIYEQTAGKRPPGNALVNRYIERVTRAAAYDEEVNLAFTKVQQLLVAPPTLFRPAIVRRVLRSRPRMLQPSPGAFAPGYEAPRSGSRPEARSA